MNGSIQTASQLWVEFLADNKRCLHGWFPARSILRETSAGVFGQRWRPGHSNADAHAKNIAIVQHTGVIHLAPFYDLLSTSVYGTNLDSGLAMSIGREYDLKKINRENIFQLAEFLDVKLRLVQKVGWELVERLTSSVSRALQAHKESYGENSVVLAIADLSVRRAKILDELLS